MRRSVFELSRCGNRHMLLSAQDQLGDDIDIADRFKQDGNNEESDGKILALFGESFFPNSWQMEDDGLDEKDMYIDHRDDRVKDIQTEIETRVLKAVRNSLSNRGKSKLNKTTNNNNLALKYRLVSGGPVKV